MTGSSGRSSTPPLLNLSLTPLEYWVARSSRAMTAVVLGRPARLHRREPRIPPLNEGAKRRRIIRADGRSHRRPRRERFPPARKLWLARQNSKIGNLVELVEITKHRTEHGVDQRKILTVKPARSDHPRFKPHQPCL